MNPKRVAIGIVSATAIVVGGGQILVSTVCACAAPKPEAKAWPVISGTTEVGETLTTDNGTWVTSGNLAEHPNQLPYHYQWKRCDASGFNCNTNVGTDSNSYTLVEADSGSTVKIYVTATNDGGTAQQASIPTSIITGGVGGGELAPLAPAGSASCDQTVSTLAAAQTDVNSSSGSTVCLSNAGSPYTGTLNFSGTHAADVTFQPVPGQNVEIHQPGGYTIVFAPNTSHIIVHGFSLYGTVQLQNGSDHIRIDHNDIVGGGSGTFVGGLPQNAGGGYYGVLLSSYDCAWWNAITWSGCPPGSQPEITNTIISGNKIHEFGLFCPGDLSDPVPHCADTNPELVSGNSEDPIFLQNTINTRITGNDIYHNDEGEWVGYGGTNNTAVGNHTDCMGETNDGKGPLIIDHNYMHDNQCLGLFPGKSGDITDLQVFDNLWLRMNRESKPEGNWRVFCTWTAHYWNNTSWPSVGDDIRDSSCHQTSQTSFDHNVVQNLCNGPCTGETLQNIVGNDYNIWGQTPSGVSVSGTDVVNANPGFVNTTTDDYRLSNNPNGIGIDWRPSDQQYGP